MTTEQHATGTFTLDSWDETSHDEYGSSELARVVVGKTFAGDLLGTSTTVRDGVLDYELAGC